MYSYLGSRFGSFYRYSTANIITKRLVYVYATKVRLLVPIEIIQLTITSYTVLSYSYMYVSRGYYNTFI